MSRLLPSSEPYQGRLPGRGRWVGLCHAEPAGCAECLRKIAEVLTAEMGWDFSTAMDRPTTAYRAEFGDDCCTLEQASELRRLTVWACVNRVCQPEGLSAGSAKNVILADDTEIAEAAAR